MTKNTTAQIWATGLVVLQLLLLAALILEPVGDWWPRNTLVLVAAATLLIAGLLVAVLGIVGLGPARTASPIPKARAPLVTHGLYGLVRSPIYSGLIILGAGQVISGASWWHLATWIALVILLAAKARWEERMLFDVHPEFADYASRVGRFIPGIGRWPRQSGAGDTQ